MRARPARPVNGKMEMHIQSELEQFESIRRGIAEIGAGHYIPHEVMKTWLLSLTLDHDVPPPKCVCGESHDKPA
jgi:predicted transcriptional regulator